MSKMSFEFFVGHFNNLSDHTGEVAIRLIILVVLITL